MAKQRQTTKSSKRYRYSSFKARIDDLKIEPARNLEKGYMIMSSHFNSLVSFINFHDEFSLQPLLDLLAQFCHDLGPDFLKFYEEAIKTLINLLDAAIEFESSNVFEWGFQLFGLHFQVSLEIFG
ncbi:BEM_collapsed_G0001970.mRNA.1.CDS.1 [Saccharomyces cerevisiae]|nr:BEM_collapsed_G0001970.mRNA.1.CDS.1 [Saccharomyces cerevisiae]